jgi:hypothetical protein
MVLRVKLETWEYEYASHIGIRRFTANWSKSDASYYDRNKMEDDRTAQVASAIGELAVAKAVDKYWSASIWAGQDHDQYKYIADVSNNIEVRRVRTQSGPAIRYKDLNRGLIIFGVKPIEPEFREVDILGWIPAEVGWETGEEISYGRIVPSERLYSVEQF